MLARRRQVQPDVIPSVEGAPHPPNDRDSTGPRITQRRAPRATSGAAIEPDTRALPGWSKRPCAAARKTTLDKADTDLLQTHRVFEGARCFPTETAKRAPARR